jgi:DHA2 family multidrug resistance protein
MTAHFASMDPKLRRILITVCTMTATVMQALDTTIANVACPMQVRFRHPWTRSTGY